MTDENEPTSSFADDMDSGFSYEAALPQKKSFLPWHRPRKQFVRDEQWCQAIEVLVKGIKTVDHKLKYLGLPGDDLLDLRFFHEKICIPQGLELSFLGFNNGARPDNTSQTECNISLDEMMKREFVDPLSDVIGDNFCGIADPRSMAWKKTSEMGPYDVINLDLCDGFGKHEPGTLDDNHYNAVSALLSLQARRQDPWLFLLTTRVGNEHIHPAVREKLLKKYEQNLDEGQPFQSASQKHFGIHDKESLDLAILEEAGLLAVSIASLCKWLLGISLNQNPPTKIEAISVVGYRIEQDSPCEDMVSIALRFEPVTHHSNDILGLAANSTIALDEGALAATALEKIASILDVDKTLRDDPALLKRTIEATKELLEDARYDGEAYQEWVG